MPFDLSSIRPLSESHLERILAVRLDNIGDMIMLGPSMRALRAAFPAAHITLMASPVGSQMAPLMPWVDEVISWRAVWQDVSGHMPFDPQRELDLVKTLAQGSYQAAFIFTSFSQSPYPPAYACYLAGIPVRVGHSKEFGGAMLTHTQKPPADHGHQVDRNLALLELTGIPVIDRHLELHIPAGTRSEVDVILQSAGIDPASPYIILAPGASCSARRYPPFRYKKVAEMISDRSSFPIVIIGSQRETETIAPVLEAAGTGSIRSLVGQTNLPQLAEVIRRSALVLANNSAALHFADAFERPMVITYSGTEYESQWEPRASSSILLRRATDCSPCYAFQCPYNLECLDISPDEVVDAAINLLVPAANFTVME